MTTIEKVARAICEAENDSDPEGLADFVERRWSEYIPAAIAALSALKDPDEGTVEAMVARVHQSGCVLIDDFDASDAGNTFNAALDHIVKGGTE